MQHQGLPSPLAIARYHSLVATHVSDSLTVTAEVDDLVSVVQKLRQGFVDSNSTLNQLWRPTVQRF